MATFVVTAPDGKEYEIDAPKGATQEQALSYFKQNWQAPQQPQEEKTVLGFLGNVGKSGANLAQGIYQAVSSPLETLKGVADIGAGALQNVLPESLVQAIGEDKASREKASQVGKFYKERYGSLEGIGNALYQDPVGVLADVATVATGGGGAIAKIPGLAKAGQVASTVGRTVDPLVMALRGTEKVASGTGKAASKILGMTTGVGDEPIKQAYLAGRTGGETGKSFVENLRGEVPVQDVLETAKSDLAAMGQQRQAAYRADMQAIRSDKSVLDFADIDNALAGAASRTEFKGQVIKPGAADKVQQARELVDNWKNLDPVEFHTPEGLDALKQQIGDILEGIPFEQKNARAAVGDVYNSIKTTINNQAPQYAKVMKNYGEASETIREIERALSLGQKSSADTAMRKLQSLMRNNVQTNYGNRLNLAKQLEQAGGQPIMPALAGQALSEWTPRGIQRATAAPSAALSYMAGGIPYAVGSAVSSSPRLIGEAALKAGQLARGLRAVKGAANSLPIPPNVLANHLYQAGVNTQGNQ